MTLPRLRLDFNRGLVLMATAGALLGACGGGSSPLGNPPNVVNGEVQGQQLLSFVYFQQCIQPILNTPLPVLDGSGATNTCASAGCHEVGRSTGGALALEPGAASQPLTGGVPETMRASAMYRNYLSARSAAIPGNPLQSNLLRKPLVLNVLHGGGQIFASTGSLQAQRISYWVTHPMPDGQDEFSASANGLFTPADSASGQCNTQ